MTTELVIDNETALREVLAGIAFAPSCLDVMSGGHSKIRFDGDLGGNPRRQ